MPPQTCESYTDTVPAPLLFVYPVTDSEARPFDWNLEVKATEKLKSVPSDLQDFIQRLLIQHPESNAIGDKLILPRPSGKDIKPPSTKVVNTRMRSSATVTLNDGQYIVEVNVTRTWDQVDFNKPPTATWGIELYGTRWEEAINTVGSNGRKKDWGKDLIEVWPGSGFGFEDRFKNFLRCVLKVKAFLDRVALNANEQLKPRD